MAAFSLAFNHLLSPPLLSVLPRPPAAVNPLSAVRFPRTTAARAFGSDDFYRPSSPSCQNGEYMLKTRVGNPDEGGMYEQRYNARREVWEGYENEDGLYLRFDMPGVGKEDIKVRVEGDNLVMQGQGEKDFEECMFGPAYKYSIQLLEVHLFDTNAVKADMVKVDQTLKKFGFAPFIHHEDKTRYHGDGMHFMCHVDADQGWDA